jgi:serine/threonine protein kinase
MGVKFIAGHNLNELLQQKVNVDWPQFFSNLLAILDSLHDLRMIHRDIIPSNLMITPNVGENTFSLVLIDFSFALIPGGKNIDSFLDKSCAMNLGLQLNPFPYMWDDAYSCHQILNQIQSHTGYYFPEYSKEFEMRIGRLSHIFGQPFPKNK